jgi:hypothetical protein
MAYHQFTDYYSGEPYGSFEVFRITRETLRSWGDDGYWEDADGSRYKFRCGWYWQSCFPGCLPDSEPMGPYRSHAAAIKGANDHA